MVGAEMISPLFPFPFYGHELTEFYITTHGFLSLSPRLHDYIYKLQHVLRALCCVQLHLLLVRDG